MSKALFVLFAIAAMLFASVSGTALATVTKGNGWVNITDSRTINGATVNINTTASPMWNGSGLKIDTAVSVLGNSYADWVLYVCSTSQGDWIRNRQQTSTHSLIYDNDVVWESVGVGDKNVTIKFSNLGAGKMDAKISGP